MRRWISSKCFWSRSGLVLCFLAALLFCTHVFMVPESHANKTPIQMVAASMGGNVYYWMAAASKVLNDELGDYEVSVRAGSTSGNILQLERGEIQLAYTSALIYSMMRGGQDSLKGTHIRAVWEMFPQFYHVIVPKDSPAKTLYDLKGKKIACGIKTGEGATFLEYMNVLGLSKDYFNLFFIGKGEGIEAFKNGSVDAFAAGCVLPSPEFAELAASRKGAKLIGFSDADLEKILSKLRPFKEMGVIPAGSHPQIDRNVKTIMHWESLCTKDDVSADFIYRVGKALYTRQKDLVAALPAAKESTADNLAKYHVFPLHPGVEKLLKELKIGGR